MDWIIACILGFILGFVIMIMFLRARYIERKKAEAFDAVHKEFMDALAKHRHNALTEASEWRSKFEKALQDKDFESVVFLMKEKQPNDRESIDIAWKTFKLKTLGL